MGSRSSTQSNPITTTTNTQDIDTTTVGAEGSGIAVSAGGPVSLSFSDQGALDAAHDIADSAFGFAGEAVQQTGRTTEAALDFANDFGGNAFDFAGLLARNANDQAENAQATLGNAITSVANASRSDTTETFKAIVKYAAIAAAVVFGLMALRKVA